MGHVDGGEAKSADAMRGARSVIPAEFVAALHELGLTSAATLSGAPLAGGVSSDIWRVDTERGPVCVKRALAKLRVAADWHAPIERNLYEARWMEVASEAVPGSAPRVLGQHPRLGVLVMDYLPADTYRLWKSDLRVGHVDVAVARAVGSALARIHAFSAARPALAARFATDAIFFDIRLEPYLLATGRRHRDLAAALAALVEATRAHAVALVHGDVSPKNILRRPAWPGVPRRRVRVVGRPGVRSRVLPQPPAAQVPVDSGRPRRLPRRVRRPRRRVPAAASAGSPRLRSSSVRPRCCRA